MFTKDKRLRLNFLISRSFLVYLVRLGHESEGSTFLVPGLFCTTRTPVFSTSLFDLDDQPFGSDVKSVEYEPGLEKRVDLGNLNWSYLSILPSRVLVSGM